MSSDAIGNIFYGTFKIILRISRLYFADVETERGLNNKRVLSAMGLWCKNICSGVGGNWKYFEIRFYLFGVKAGITAGTPKNILMTFHDLSAVAASLHTDSFSIELCPSVLKPLFPSHDPIVPLSWCEQQINVIHKTMCTSILNACTKRRRKMTEKEFQWWTFKAADDSQLRHEPLLHELGLRVDLLLKSEIHKETPKHWCELSRLHGSCFFLCTKPFGSTYIAL